MLTHSAAEIRMITRTVPHIVQYQGSKRNLAPLILQYMPRKFNRLIEPFAGMAAITIAVSKQQRANQYSLNVLNAPLMGILREAIETPDVLVAEYSKVWNEQLVFEGGSVAHFYKVRDEFNAGDKSAANMLYLLARCVKGSVRYSSTGMFNQSPDKRRKGTSPTTLAKNVYQISSYLKGKTTFSSLPSLFNLYILSLARCLFTTEFLPFQVEFALALPALEKNSGFSFAYRPKPALPSLDS